MSRQTSRPHAAIALISGVLTLGIEIVAGRLLAPFFGSSLHQWAALIGVVLIAYVLGYAWYGKLSRWGLELPLVLGGVYVLSLPLWLNAAVNTFLDLPLSVASVVGALISAGIPSVLWASVLPTLQFQVGPKKSARVLAWSAIGNLIGVWGVAFSFIPVLGTRTTLLLLGAAALGLGLVTWRVLPRESRRGGGNRAIGILWIFALGAGGFLALWNFQGREGGVPEAIDQILEARDSAYQRIVVSQGASDPELQTGPRRALSLNGSLQFLWSEKEKLTAGSRYEYYNYSTAAATWVGAAQGGDSAGLAREVLILGLGGGLIPWQLREFYPSIGITAYELDGDVVEVARRWLPLSKLSDVEVRIGDGRNLMMHPSPTAGKDARRFDYILLDTFLNSYVPFHLTTREFFEAAKNRLTRGGILVANFHTVFAESGLLPKLEATIRSVFPSVGVMHLPSGTTLVLASAEEVSLRDRLLSSARTAPLDLALLSEKAARSIRSAALPSPDLGNILTDDLNDTEQRLYETRRRVIVASPF